MLVISGIDCLFTEVGNSKTVITSVSVGTSHTVFVCFQRLHFTCKMFMMLNVKGRALCIYVA